MLESITESNFDEFDRLVYEYEEEFSPITEKKKGEDGKYPLDSDWREPNNDYYWVVEGKRIGFCIKGPVGSIQIFLNFTLSLQ